MLRPSASRPVCLGVKPHLGPKTRFLLLLGSSGFPDVDLSNDRMGLLLVLSSAVILESKYRETYDHILLSKLVQSYITTGGLPPISSSWRQAN
jgi:hypothetical protein